jgi:curved DNA-binding protein
VPKGISNQTVLRKERAGHQGFKSKNGDLYVKVDIPEDKYFKVEGQNVKTTQYIPISVAVLGGKVTVKTLRGMVEVNVAPGTQSGE